MEINWFKVRRVILNDRSRRVYRPDRTALNKVAYLLPKAVIFGFGFYQQAGFWMLLVESPEFEDNPYGVIRDVFITNLALKPVVLQLLPGTFPKI